MMLKKKGMSFHMQTPQILRHQEYIYIRHDKYHRFIRYSRGISIPYDTFQHILATLDDNTRSYFFFHNNPTVTIQVGSYLNGHASLAAVLYTYFQQRNILLPEIMNGQDFYIHITA